MRNRKQITVTFTVDEEWVPGLFYDPQDFADQAFKSIQHSMSAYKPELVSTFVDHLYSDKDCRGIEQPSKKG